MVGVVFIGQVGVVAEVLYISFSHRRLLSMVFSPLRVHMKIENDFVTFNHFSHPIPIPLPYSEKKEERKKKNSFNKMINEKYFDGLCYMDRPVQTATSASVWMGACPRRLFLIQLCYTIRVDDRGDDRAHTHGGQDYFIRTGLTHPM